MSSNKIVVIDCQVAGISGDMFLAALLDLGANINRVVQAIKHLKNYIESCGDIKVHIRDVLKEGFHAKKIDVEAKFKKSAIKGMDLIRIVENSLVDLCLGKNATKFASNAIKTLISTEAKIHGESIEDVHLHEAGAIDTPSEIVGSAVALESLGLFNAKIYATPVAVGGGTFKFSHGTVSSPAPATLEILRSKGFPIIGGPVDYELTTPTGASILVSLADAVSRFYPLMVPRRVGYGAGNRDIKGVPNVLRMVMGESFGYNLLKDEIVIVETNLDDVTGEVIGHLVERIMAEGARDISIVPIFTKKNRPGQIVKIITDRTNAERISHVLIEETGSLGVRILPCERRILARKLFTVDVRIGDFKEKVLVKVATDAKGKVIQIKPEYDDSKKISEKTGIPLRDVLKIIEEEARRIIL